MKTRSIDLEPLRHAIRQRGLMSSWGDGLFVKSAAEAQQRSHEKAIEAKNDYVRMMSSGKNDGSGRYQQWALHKALGLTLKRSGAGYGVRASAGRSNRGLN